MEKSVSLIVEKATRLIYYGIEKQRTYTKNPDYQSLLNEFENDSQFRLILNSVASGFKLEVLAINQSGVYLRPWKDSTFAISLTDINRLTGRDTDEYIGLILIALAAYYFPKEMDFQDPPSLPVSVFDLDEYIREKCKLIKQNLSESDMVQEEKSLEKLAISYYQKSSIDDQKEKSKDTTTAMIRKVLKFLTKEKLFTKYGNDDDTFLPTYRFSLAMDSMVNNQYLIEFLDIIQ